MMMQKQDSQSLSNNRKRKLLHALYEVYTGWIERFPLACQAGCAACCTQSVTMTSLEGEVILDFFKRNGEKKWLTEKLSRVASGKSKREVTTNQYAAACLEEQEIDADASVGWDFTPCIFLEKNRCSIYEVRPFGCRSFVSFVRCSDDRGAEIAPVHLAVNTVFTQIVEHLSSDGGHWGNMTDILRNLSEINEPGSIGLIPARPIPGFLLEPQEIKVVHELLSQLYGQSEEKQTIGDLIDNFMPLL